MWTAFFARETGKDFTGETRAAANIKNEGRRVEIEKLKGSMGHIGLNVTDTGGSGVFARFIVVVKEIRGPLPEEKTKGQYGNQEYFMCSLSTHKISSGRDMVAIVVDAQYSIEEGRETR